MNRGVISYRAVDPRDSDAMFAIVKHWEVARQLGSWSWPPDPELARKRCQPFEGDGLVWAICHDGAFIGNIAVVNGVLGYMLHPAFHGRGIMSLAVWDILSYAFDQFDLDQVSACVWADNPASRHILMKTGFDLMVEEVVHALARNEPTARETYSLSRSEWFSRNPPCLMTDRLVLRALHIDDADAIVRIAGNYEVSKWLMPVPHPYDLFDAHAFLTRAKAGEEGPVWAITQDNAMIGMIGLDEIVGYYLQPESWGQGLMSEAVAAVVAWRFSLGDLDCIHSGFFEGNQGSRRVLEKTGFRNTRKDMSFSAARGEEVPHHRMELSRAAWSTLMPAQE